MTEAVLLAVAIIILFIAYRIHTALIRLHLDELSHRLRAGDSKDDDLHEWEYKVGHLVRIPSFMPFQKHRLDHYGTYYKQYIAKHYPNHDSSVLHRVNKAVNRAAKKVNKKKD